MGKNIGRLCSIVPFLELLKDLWRSFIEHYAGKFPLWAAPVQAVVATITQEGDEYAQKVYERLKAAGIRVELDVRNEKINFKIRELSLQKIPYIIVVGKREAH
jgi:threonyl-tRNA synthetase